MEYLSALKKSVVAGLMIGIGCTVFLNMDNSIVAVIFIRIRTFYDYQFGIEFVYRQDRIISVKKIVPRH